MGVYRILAGESKHSEAVKRVFKRAGRGRYGVSFYVGRKEVFIGLEIADVLVPPKTLEPKRILKKSKVTYVPIRS